jgi:hypothetical protein
MGYEPSVRWGASMSLIGDDLYVFGGRDNVSHFQDFYKFNIPTCRWTKMPVEKVFFFSSAIFLDSRYFLFLSSLSPSLLLHHLTSSLFPLPSVLPLPFIPSLFPPSSLTFPGSPSRPVLPLLRRPQKFNYPFMGKKFIRF